MHQGAQTRIGFQHARIDPQVPTPKKPLCFERREHYFENSLVNLPPKPLADTVRLL